MDSPFGLRRVGETTKIYIPALVAREARRRASILHPLHATQRSRMRPSGPEIAPVATFPPALPSPARRCAIRMAFLESQLEGSARREAGCSGATVGPSAKVNKNVPAKPAHHGDAGWEDRFSDPGWPKAASRRGEAPRGGAFLLLGSVGSSRRGVIHKQGYPKTHHTPSDSKILLGFKIQGPQRRGNPREMVSKSERWGRVA